MRQWLLGLIGAFSPLTGCWSLEWCSRGASFFFNEFRSVLQVFFTLIAGVARAGDAPQNKTVSRRLEGTHNSSLPKQSKSIQRPRLISKALTALSDCLCVLIDTCKRLRA